MTYNVFVSPAQVVTDSAAMSLDVEDRRCLDTHERELTFFNEYTQASTNIQAWLPTRHAPCHVSHIFNIIILFNVLYCNSFPICFSHKCEILIEHPTAVGLCVQ